MSEKFEFWFGNRNYNCTDLCSDIVMIEISSETTEVD